MPVIKLTRAKKYEITLLMIEGATAESMALKYGVSSRYCRSLLKEAMEVNEFKYAPCWHCAGEPAKDDIFCGLPCEIAYKKARPMFYSGEEIAALTPDSLVADDG